MLVDQLSGDEAVALCRVLLLLVGQRSASLGAAALVQAAERGGFFIGVEDGHRRHFGDGSGRVRLHLFGRFVHLVLNWNQW